MVELCCVDTTRHTLCPLSLSLSHNSCDVQSQPQMEDQWPPGIPTIKTPPQTSPGRETREQYRAIEILIEIELQTLRNIYILPPGLLDS